MDNRQGLVVDVMLAPAGGTSERDAAIVMLGAVPGAGRITVGVDRGYDTRKSADDATILRWVNSNLLLLHILMLLLTPGQEHPKDASR